MMSQNTIHQVVKCDSNRHYADRASYHRVSLEIITDEDGIQISLEDSDYDALIVTIEPIAADNDRLHLRTWTLAELAKRELGKPISDTCIEGG